MDFAVALDTGIYSLMWILFSLFIGIALAIDLGILNKLVKFLKAKGNKHNTRNDGISQETKAQSQSSKDQSLQEQQEKRQKEQNSEELLAGLFYGYPFPVYLLE